MYARFLAACLFTGSLVFLLLFPFTYQASAQIGNSTLSGTVTDASGAAIVGAQLTLTNKATSFQQKVTSNERGEYTFRNLTPATYDLDVTMVGFQKYVQSDIELTINQSGRADAVLRAGAATETVTVQGENTLINYDDGTLQGGIDPQTVKDLPLIVSGKPRSSASFAVLLPGVSSGSSNEAFNARINGGIQSGDEALLDGATMQEGFMSQSGMVSIQGDFQMSPDMVQEVKVLTSDYAPQYGSSTSGQITMVSKSGTTKYHGAVFEYARNRWLNAKPWNAPPCGSPGCDQRPPDNEHDFGANFGGPIKIPHLYEGTSKHRSYFYFDWEAFHQAGGATRPTISIPSLSERSGDFSDWAFPIYAPGSFAPGSNSNQSTGPQSVACMNALPSGFGPGQHFPGNVIPSACVSPIAAAYLAELPQPTNSGAQDNYTAPRPVPDTLVANSNVFMTRIDHNYGDKDHFYFFWWRQFTGYNTATLLPPAIATEEPTRPQNSPISRFNWEHTFSSTVTNHVTVGYLNRNEGYGSVNLDFIGKLPQIAGAPGTNALPRFDFGDGFTQLGDQSGPSGGNITARPTWVINDLVNIVRGHHTLTFGGEWRSVQGNVHQHTNQAGTYGFDRSTTAIPGPTSGSAVASYLLGAVSGGSVDWRTVPSWYPRQVVWALHGNDSWRVTPKLTVNYGMRWDYYSPSREKFNHFSFFDPAGANPTAGIPGRLAFAGSGSSCGQACYGNEFPERPWHNGFAPRLSFAYALNPKTVVRAGYGVFFTQAFYPGWNAGMSLDGYNLNQAFGTHLDPNTNQDDPAFYLDNGVPLPAQLPPFISGAYDNGKTPTYRPLDANRRSYSQQWNLTIERQLPKDVYLSVAYVANKGTRLPSNLLPINVLNPFDPRIKALEANTTPIDPSCATANPAPNVNCGYVPELSAVFNSDSQTLYGVTSPYSGWVADMTSTGQCNPDVAQALLPYPQYCGTMIGLNENHGSSIYHSFQLKFEKRYKKSLYMLVAYTNSKLITDAADNTQSNASTWNSSQGVISPFEIRRNRSLTPDDVPQTLSAAFVYELPLGEGKPYLSENKVLSHIVGGWEISPVIRYSSGTPLFVRSGSCEVVGQFGQGCLVGLVPGAKPFLQNPNDFDPNKGPVLNPAAFEPLDAFQPAGSCPTCTGVFGYTGSGPRVLNIRGPHYQNVDFALTKNTRISERVNFQFRAEFYNAFNYHVFVDDSNFNISNGNGGSLHTDVSDPSFGQWSGNVSAPRRIQLGARLEF
ncbi:MAG TPA: TonB-dependent receptor [Terriglobales bacterium]|jgi:hypothetical protein|nr:TonB-dependent receptor [Terriglobales bacterium]